MSDNSLPRTISAWLARFTSNCTIKMYRICIRRLIEYLPEKADVEQASMDDVMLASQRFRANEAPKPPKWNLTINAWRSYYEYLVNSERRESNPASNLKPRKIADKVQPTPTEDEVLKIWDALLNEDDWTFADIHGKRVIVRDRAVFALLISTGIRASEICRLVVGDFNVRRREITFWGKGEIPRRVTWSPEAHRFVVDAIAGRAPDAVAFPSLALPSKTEYDRLYPEAISRRILEPLCEVAGIPRYSAHAFRRFAITYAFRLGVDPREVQRAAGHSSINTTLAYDADRQKPGSLRGLFPTSTIKRKG